jgi:hypothetical protein
MNKLSHAKFFWLFFLALNKMEFNTVVGTTKNTAVDKIQLTFLDIEEEDEKTLSILKESLKNFNNPFNQNLISELISEFNLKQLTNIKELSDTQKQYKNNKNTIEQHNNSIAQVQYKMEQAEQEKLQVDEGIITLDIRIKAAEERKKRYSNTNNIEQEINQLQALKQEEVVKQDTLKIKIETQQLELLELSKLDQKKYSEMQESFQKKYTETQNDFYKKIIEVKEKSLEIENLNIEHESLNIDKLKVHLIIKNQLDAIEAKIKNIRDKTLSDLKAKKNILGYNLAIKKLQAEYQIFDAKETCQKTLFDIRSQILKEREKLFDNKRNNFNTEENQQKSYIFLSDFCEENSDILKKFQTHIEIFIVSLCSYNINLFYKDGINKDNIEKIIQNFSTKSKISKITGITNFAHRDLTEIAKKNEITKENTEKISQFCDAYHILNNIDNTKGNSLTNKFDIIQSFFLQDKFVDPLLLNKLYISLIYDKLKKDYQTLKSFEKKEDKNFLKNIIKGITKKDLKKETELIFNNTNITDEAQISEINKILTSYSGNLHVFFSDTNNQNKQELTEEEKKKLKESNDYKFYNIFQDIDIDNTNIYLSIESNKLFIDKIKSSNENSFIKNEIIERLFGEKSGKIKTKEESMSKEDLEKEKEAFGNLKKYFNLEKKNQTTDTNNSKDEDKKTNDEQQNTTTPIENQNQKKSFVQQHSRTILVTTGLLLTIGGVAYLIHSSEKENTQLVAAA